MFPLRILFRVAGVLFWVLSGWILILFQPIWPLSFRRVVIRLWSRLLLLILGIRIDLKGKLPEGGALLVANHVSWLDIFVINSHRATHFVAKSEIRDWPVLGFLVGRAGTFYLDRGRGRDALRVMHHIRAVMEQGEWVALFPEGGIGDGLTVRPFRGFLFESAAGQSVPVCPIALKYTDEQGLPHLAPIWFDVSFFRSFMRVVAAQHIVVQAETCPLLTDPDRRVLAHHARTLIVQKLGGGSGRARDREHLPIVKPYSGK
ncbi:MAG: 1-acyl-sn-glycerol-3-phosphate acyltransferase [Proteobacteria bacterium]|nr:1-acyl-sn-glycerol-3-phosphate acyltransferase [Pseudomonadota bacterium]MDE3208890.1 1-acyl-sn-glycerol-3-phosphate acyltransferase [Pseudomonadota bacterium]